MNLRPLSLLPAALALLAPAAWSQQPPTGGSQLRQIPPSPQLQPPPPALDVQPLPAPAPAGPDGARILVNTLKVTGATSFREADLLAASGFEPGRELTLAQLRTFAERIAAFYRANGFLVAQAYLPAQQIQDGAVTVAVIEGRYGKVDLRNTSRLSDPVAQRLLHGLDSGDAVLLEPLESRLLQLSELPGIKLKSTLVPGQLPGTSDLLVELTPGQRVNGSIDADNAGNRYTGVGRVGATLSVNEPLGLGDVATLRVLTSGSGLQYARASYHLQVGRGKVGVALSGLRYELGREFEAVGAHGTVRVASLYGSYPLVRSRSSNLYLLGNLDAKRFRDVVDTTGAVSEKDARVATVALQGDHTDGIGGGGVNAWSLAFSGGDIDLRTPADRAADAATARTQGGFGKLAFSATRLQAVSDRLSLYVSANGQLASENLDVSEKMQLGGMYAVRAYPEGEAYADEGVVLSAELRWLMPPWRDASDGRLYLIGFVDAGAVTTNKDPWLAGRNRRTLSGAGVGVNWFGANNLEVKAYYAFKLGNEAATSAPDRSGRFWVQAVKYF